MDCWAASEGVMLTSLCGSPETQWTHDDVSTSIRRRTMSYDVVSTLKRRRGSPEIGI